MTVALRYGAGLLPTVGADGFVAILAVDVDDPRVDRIVEASDSPTRLDDIVDILVERGVRSMPDFAACARTPDGVRIAFRGGFSVTVDGAALVSDAGPWTDRTVPAATVEILRVGEASVGRTLPLRSGLVLANAVVLGEPRSAAPNLPDPPLASGEPHLEPAPDADPVSLVKTADPLDAAEGVALGVQAEESGAKNVSLGAAPPAAHAESSPSPAPGGPSGEPATDFDFLFQATTMRQALEDAAPRHSPATAEEHPPARSGATAQGIPPSVVDLGVTRASPHTIDAAELLHSDPAPQPSGPMITAMPWSIGGAPSAPEPRGVPGGSSFAVPPNPVALPAPVAYSPASSPDPAEAAAREERTINRSQLLAQNQSAQLVLAARCPQGHLTQAYGAVCRVCRQPVPPQEHLEVPRPTLGALRLSTGAVVALDRGAILGRNPRVPSDFHGEQPNLVRVVDPDKGVSSQHVEVSLDYWNVNVRDLGSTNGTEVVLPGAMPMMLAKGAMVILEPGSRVIMGGQVSFVFEVTM